MSITETSRKISFIQPRHNYAPEAGDGHIHLSAPMITIMSQIHEAANGVLKMTHIDENFECERGEIDANTVAVNLVGAPYVSEAIKIIQRVRAGATVILGGQIVDSLNKDFEQLFNVVRMDVRVINGNNLEVLRKELGISYIPEKEDVSTIPIWKIIDDEQMKKYLQHGMSFYLAQGCKHHCTFCQAKKGTPEKYRDLNIAKRDLEWLTDKAIDLGICELDIYFSNLDIFQTGEELEKFLDKILEIREKNPGFTYKLRGLTTVDSMKIIDEEILKKAKKAGFIAIGFGIDGATPAVWVKTAKTHNFSDDGKNRTEKCINAVERCHRVGITPEILMVFGHDTGDFKESKEDLETALQFTKDMINRFGAIPRPHVVKTLVPGAVEWERRKTNMDKIELLLKNPEYFQALDYTALPSEISHPDKTLRSLVEKYYKKVCALVPEHSTKIVYPNTPATQKWAREIGTTIEELNEGKYDR